MTTSAKPRTRGNEVHEHHFITGPRANGPCSKFAHAHDDGAGPHVHDDGTSRTGPAARTIDKDEWFAATGLRGGGRKRFVSGQTGPQLPTVQTEALRIEVVIVGDGGAAIADGHTGGADATLARMRLAMGARVVSVDGGPGRRARGAA